MPLWVRTIWITGPSSEVEEAARSHRRRLEELASDGRLHVSGVVGDDQGFIDVFDAEDRLAAEAEARASALVARGLGAWTVRRWTDWTVLLGGAKK